MVVLPHPPLVVRADPRPPPPIMGPTSSPPCLVQRRCDTAGTGPTSVSRSICPRETLGGGLKRGRDDALSPQSSSLCPAAGLLEGCLL